MPAKLKAKQAKVEAKKDTAAVSKAKDVKKDVKVADSKSKSKAKATVAVVPPPSPPKKATTVKKTNSKDAKSTKKAPSPVKVPSPKKAPSPKKTDPPAKSAPKRPAPAGDDKKDATSGIKKTKSDEQIVKVITKGGAAVDSLVPNKDAYRVFQDGGKIYSATLNQSKLD